MRLQSRRLNSFARRRLETAGALILTIVVFSYLALLGIGIIDMSV